MERFFSELQKDIFCPSFKVRDITAYYKIKLKDHQFLYNLIALLKQKDFTLKLSDEALNYCLGIFKWNDIQVVNDIIKTVKSRNLIMLHAFIKQECEVPVFEDMPIITCIDNEEAAIIKKFKKKTIINKPANKDMDVELPLWKQLPSKIPSLIYHLDDEALVDTLTQILENSQSIVLSRILLKECIHKRCVKEFPRIYQSLFKKFKFDGFEVFFRQDMQKGEIEVLKMNVDVEFLVKMEYVVINDGFLDLFQGVFSRKQDLKASVSFFKKISVCENFSKCGNILLKFVSQNKDGLKAFKGDLEGFAHYLDGALGNALLNILDM